MTGHISGHVLFFYAVIISISNVIEMKNYK